MISRAERLPGVQVDSAVRWRRWLQWSIPWLLCAGILFWGWRGISLAHSLPSYGDELELTWGISWYSHALATGQNAGVYPLAFYPGGWNLSTYAVGPGLLVALLPLNALGGPAFALNAASLLTFLVAFGGMLVLAGRFLKRPAAAVAALLFTFWSLRWFATIGHLNVLVGSALLPWALWALDRALAADVASGRDAGGAPGVPRPLPAGAVSPRAWAWLGLAGIFWAGALTSSLYFAWLSGLALALWLLGRRLAGQISWRVAGLAMIVPMVVALLLNAPGIWQLWRGSADAGAEFYPFIEVSYWCASLNSLFLPYLDHPWLGELARSVYRGTPYEQAATNLGTLATVAAALAVPAAWRDRRWRPALLLAPVGIVLALGLVLKWDNEPVQWAALRPLNALWWRLGYWLKPGFFTSPTPQPPFVDAVPLPGLLVAMFVPFVDRARVFARYALPASVGLFLLAGLAVARLRPRWLGAVLAAALLFEVLPPPLPSVPFPPAPHPAFTWLAAQPAEAVVADVVAAHPSTLGLLVGGETIWATRLHDHPTVAGASSVWPAHTRFLYDWLVTHQHPFWNGDLTEILRAYNVRYLLLHERSDLERGLLQEARADKELRLVRCFDPPAGRGPWSYPICALEVLPSATPDFNVLLGDGWSGRESWGVWGEGTHGQATWVATSRGAVTLDVAAFPQCVPGQAQEVAVTFNGQEIARYTWPGCDPWSVQVSVPAGLVRVGANNIGFQAAHATSPAAVTNGQNADTRALSIALTRLKITPAR